MASIDIPSTIRSSSKAAMLGGRRTSRPLSAFTTGYWTSRLSKAPVGGPVRFGVRAAAPRAEEEDDDKGCVSPRPPDGFGIWTLNVFKESDSIACSPSAVRTEERGRNGKKVVSPLASGNKNKKCSLLCREGLVVERETYTQPITFDGNKRLSLLSRGVDAHDSSVRVHRHDNFRHRRNGHRR